MNMTNDSKESEACEVEALLGCSGTDWHKAALHSACSQCVVRACEGGGGVQASDVECAGRTALLGIGGARNKRRDVAVSVVEVVCCRCNDGLEAGGSVV